ncbi:MAG: hypothetical protein B5M55_06985 [Desulfococcus sp. 4484_242]|nr:MAG: hypothetical protein B5M55_06985 [Desulfococcus sp. 4484_242]
MQVLGDMENANHDDLKKEIERGAFVRAVFLAESLGLPKEETRNLQARALCQMAVEYRNALGTQKLARQYGFSRADLKETLNQYVEKLRHEGKVRMLEPSYDHHTRKYLTFEEWMALFFKKPDL